MTARITDRPLRRGYRRDLETESGRHAAMWHGMQHGGRLFTDAERRKGHDTQRQQGRFGKGRFTPVYPSGVGDEV
jgi:hypothetical protein